MNDKTEKMRNFISVKDIGNLDNAVKEALEIKADRYRFCELGRNKTLMMVFFNSSLRTRLSTQKAALNLGPSDGFTDSLDLDDGLFDHRIGRQRFHCVMIHTKTVPIAAQLQQLDRSGTDVDAEQRRLTFRVQWHPTAV